MYSCGNNTFTLGLNNHINYDTFQKVTKAFQLENNNKKMINIYPLTYSYIYEDENHNLYITGYSGIYTPNISEKINIVPTK